MSAIKHMKAKTVHIPLNSKTGKRRKFAIVGFKSIDDMNIAITNHVFLFGNKTWWSTKDNTNVIKERAELIVKDRTLHKDTDPNPRLDIRHKTAHTSTYMPFQQRKVNKKGNNHIKGKEKVNIHITNKSNKGATDILTQLANQLNQVNTRLANLERTNLEATGSITPNRS